MQKIKLEKKYADKKKNLITNIKLDSLTTTPNLIAIVLLSN